MGPGSYHDANYNFGKDAKGFTIGEKRPEKLGDGLGPGAYDPEKADAMTRSRMPRVDFSGSPSRGNSPNRNNAHDSNVGPGQYDDRSYERAKENNRWFTIGVKREQAIEETMGPGSYDPDKAEMLTKPRNPSVSFDGSPNRPERVGQTMVPSAPPQQFSFSNAG